MLMLLLMALMVAMIRSDCITMKNVEKHMPEWVDIVPYSHLKNNTWGYPTDCSGFVSYVLHTDKDLKAYEYASDKYSSAIAKEELRYGDIITHVFGDHCEKKDIVEEGDIAESRVGDGENEEVFEDDNVSMELLWPDIPEISGHVFFFDRWANEEHSQFWAYESSETQDQTEACLKQDNLMTRSECLNHHVMKDSKLLDKYTRDVCKSKQYGKIIGGPKRLSKKLLCRD